MHFLTPPSSDFDSFFLLPGKDEMLGFPELGNSEDDEEEEEDVAELDEAACCVAAAFVRLLLARDGRAGSSETPTLEFGEGIGLLQEGKGLSEKESSTNLDSHSSSAASSLGM